jgi:hypothetical protein
MIAGWSSGSAEVIEGIAAWNTWIMSCAARLSSTADREVTQWTLPLSESPC